MRLGINLSVNKLKGIILGPGLVSDGAFDSAANWTLPTETTISGGTLNYNNTTAVRTVTHNPNISAVVGRRYRIVYTITSYTGSGNIRFSFGGVAGINRTASGTYTQDITAVSTAVFSLVATTGAIASLDNVSVRGIF